MTAKVKGMTRTGVYQGDGALHLDTSVSKKKGTMAIRKAFNRVT